MKSIKLILVAILPFLAQATLAQSLYTGFNGGLVNFAGNGQVHLYALATETDGSCFFTGYDASSDPDGQYDIVVGKLLTDGTLDATFGEGGLVYIGIGANTFEYGYDIDIQSDGKLVVSYYFNSNGNVGYNVLRLLPNGVLDTTFNGTGFGEVLAGPQTQQDDKCPLTLQEDGKSLILSRSANPDLGLQLEVVRRNADGTVDTDFADGGRQLINFINLPQVDESGDMAVLPNGTIAVSGTNNFNLEFLPNSDMGVAMLNPAGSFDTNFSEDGLNTYNPGTDPRFDKALSIYVTSDGDLLVLGQVTIPGLSGHRVALLKLHPDGNINPDFGTNGVVELDASITELGSSAALSAVTLPDGDLLILASNDEASTGNVSLIKMSQDGVLDTSFGNNGFFNFGDEEFPVRTLAMAASPDFAYIYVLASGYSTDPRGYIFCVGINDSSSGVRNTKPENYLTFYPNPASDVVTFYAASANETYTTMTLQGKIILNGQTRQGKNVLDLSPFENGVYLIRVGESVGKVVKN